MDAAKAALPLLEHGEPLTVLGDEVERQIPGEELDPRYRGEYRRFLNIGFNAVQPHVDAFLSAAKAPEHEDHQLVRELHTVFGETMDLAGERVATNPGRYKRGVTQVPTTLEAYTVPFSGNIQDMMLTMADIQKAYLLHLIDNGILSHTPPEVLGKFTMANFDTVARVAYMQGERYSRVLFPLRSEEPNAVNPLFKTQFFTVNGDYGDFQLAVDPEFHSNGESQLAIASQFASLQDADPGFCAGLIAVKAPQEDQAFVEHFMSIGDMPTGRLPDDPDYGKVKPIQLFGVLARNIAEHTIFRTGK